jgi:hypothetical protein
MKHISPRVAINATTSFNRKLTSSAVRFFFSPDLFPPVPILSTQEKTGQVSPPSLYIPMRLFLFFLFTKFYPGSFERPLNEILKTNYFL